MDEGGAATTLIECASCHELNRQASRRCARRGVSLGAHVAPGIDPELASFQRSQVQDRQDQYLRDVAKRRIVMGDHPHLDQVMRAVAPGVDGGGNSTVAAGFAVLDGALLNQPSNEGSLAPSSFADDALASTQLECAFCHELNQRGAQECARCGERLPLSPPPTPDRLAPVVASGVTTSDSSPERSARGIRGRLRRK